VSAEADGYLARLARELEVRGVTDPLIIEEARSHLADAIDGGLQRGVPCGVAEREAIARFGGPELVAATFAAERHLMRNRILLAAAVAFGICIAYVDSRPGWDDSGITAFSMLLVAGLLGFFGPQSPWLWALGVGAFIPLHAVVANPSLGAVAMLVVLLFPLAGAYGGMGVRHLIDRPARQGR
jgi:hypothetical protein